MAEAKTRERAKDISRAIPNPTAHLPECDCGIKSIFIIEID
jgi:hypothetical protein